MSTTGLSSPVAEWRGVHELPQPLYLFELLTESRHYHFGYYPNGSAESIATAMTQLSRECISVLPDRSRVLDVGCALGGTSIELAAAGFDVVGIDPCAPAIAYAREAMASGPARVHFERSDLETYARDGAERGSFGSIVMIEVLQHFPRLTEALLRCRRLLAPGGTVVIGDIVKFPDLRWSRVPFHRLNDLAIAAKEAQLDVVERRDVTSRVSATTSHMTEAARALPARLAERPALIRPSVQQDLDELLLQLLQLETGFANGDLAYELTVLRRT